MSKQQQAPGALEHVRAFVNTVDIEEGLERLPDPPALSAWLIKRGLADPGLRATSSDLRHAVQLREALRAILLSHNGSGKVPETARQTLDDAVCRARVRLRFDRHGSAT